MGACPTARHIPRSHVYRRLRGIQPVPIRSEANFLAYRVMWKHGLVKFKTPGQLINIQNPHFAQNTVAGTNKQRRAGTIYLEIGDMFPNVIWS